MKWRYVLFILLVPAVVLSAWHFWEEPSEELIQTPKMPEPVVRVSVPSWSDNNEHKKELTAELRPAFDHFLLMYQSDESVMWQQFSIFCQQYHQCSELKVLFMGFIEYKRALMQLEPVDESTPLQLSLETQLNARKALLHSLFSAEQMALLFADELAWEEGAMLRRKIFQDPGLTDQQKYRNLQQHIAQLPTEQKQVFQPTMDLRAIEQIQQQWQDPLSAYNVYAAEFGDESAQRLVVVQQQQSRWRQRVAEFKQQQRQIIAELSDPLRRQNQLQMLQASLFEPEEIRRLQVYLQYPDL